MKPRTLPELLRMSDADCRAMLGELCGVNQSPDRDSRHDWLPFGDDSILVESSFVEDDPDVGIVGGFVATSAYVNGQWVSVDEYFPEWGYGWSAEVQRISDQELRDHRAQGLG